MKPTMILATLLLSPAVTFAAGSLELPNSRASGIGVVAGWKCQPVGNLTVEFDGGEPLPLAKGISRRDTSAVCGNSGLNGFIAQYNYNLLGTGTHTAVVRDDGVEFDRHTFVVQTFGVNFLDGASGGGIIGSFPTAGSSTSVAWDEGSQNFVITSVQSESIFNETFEAGIGVWFADNGVWQVGTPTYGPSECHQGTVCATTGLTGNYPAQFFSRLVSPSIELPDLILGDELRLRFWGWHYFGVYAEGGIQIQEFDRMTGTWLPWSATLDGSTVAGQSNGWSLKSVDIPPSFAGKRIRLGFFASHPAYYYAPGWYIDEVEILKLR